MERGGGGGEADKEEKKGEKKEEEEEEETALNNYSTLTCPMSRGNRREEGVEGEEDNDKGDKKEKVDEEEEEETTLNYYTVPTCSMAQIKEHPTTLGLPDIRVDTSAFLGHNVPLVPVECVCEDVPCSQIPWAAQHTCTMCKCTMFFSFCIPQLDLWGSPFSFFCVPQLDLWGSPFSFFCVPS